MSRAPRVKINNNLQVAECRRVGWLSLQRQLFSGSVHRCMVSVLSCCCWGLNLRLDITTIWENSSIRPNDTFLLCFTTSQWLALHSDVLLLYLSQIPCSELFTQLENYINVAKVSKVLIWSLFLDGSTGESHIQKLMTRWEKELKIIWKFFPFKICLSL